MKKIVVRWAKKKVRKAKWKVAGWATGIAWLILSVITGDGVRGFFALVTLVALGLVYVGFMRFVFPRVQAMADSGVPFSPLRVWRDIWTDREKFVVHDDRWALAMRVQKVVYDGFSPKLNRKTTTATGDVTASINPGALGGNLDAITRLAADGTLAGIMRCKEVSVQPTDHGKAKITFYNTPPLQREFKLADLPASGKGRITFGIQESGEPASVRYGLSMLVVSATGGGKSVTFKNMFTDIRRDGDPTWMYFVDPKRMELARFKPLIGQWIGNIRIAGYCNTAAEAEAMFRQFAADMHARQERLAELGMTELKRPTPELPQRIIVADEMADIKATFDKMDKPLPIIISQGRATLDSLIGLAQVAKIETLGTVRDLVSLRAGLRMMTPENTKAALGISEADGAPCSRIPLSTPGVGYYVTDAGEVRKFRTAKVTDKDWDALLAGELPEGMQVNVEDIGPECFVYDAPLKGSMDRAYVGIAGADGTRHPVDIRRARHRKYDRAWCVEHGQVENFWKVHVDDHRMEVYKYPSRAAARIAEEQLIRNPKAFVPPDGRLPKFNGRPVWNIQHNTDNPDSNVALARRAGVKTRVVDAGREWAQFGRDSWALHQVKAGFRKQERIARIRDRHHQFDQRVLQDSYR